MIGKVFQFFQTLVLLAAIIGFGVVTYQGYKLYRGVADRMDQIGQWIDRFQNQERRWARCEERIDELKKLFDRIRPGESRTIEDVIKEADPTPIPIDQTVIQKPLKPTVIMQSMEGCGPCEDWWRNNAARWEAAGWTVKRENGTDAGPFPWFRVWDGEKWLTVRDRLTLESYKRAGGK